MTLVGEGGSNSSFNPAAGRAPRRGLAPVAATGYFKR